MLGTTFGSYDRTAQATGAPLSHTLSHEEQDNNDNGGQSAQGLSLSKSRSRSHSHEAKTQATSLTETGGLDDSPRKPITPAETETANGEDVDDETTESDEEEGRRNSLVHNLARRFTTQSHYSALMGENPFFSDETSPLNPNSEHFKAHAWAKAMVHMMQQEGASFRTSGVCFQDLNVYGDVVATDYQKSVGNVWLEGAGLVRRALGMGNKRRIDILREFDGLVRNGEMLVVLGPPGSGCSTFLKTIAGETNGIYVDDGSYFNYQGEFNLYFISWSTHHFHPCHWL